MSGSKPRDILLETASRLFYRDGINAVGVDRILTEAGVTRATLYRHFAGKEALVVAYLQREDQLMRVRFSATATRAVSPEHALELAIEGIANDAYQRHTRGCPFIKAASEFPDPSSPVRQLITGHRGWFHDDLRQMLTAAGRDDVEAKVARLSMMRDALLVAAFLDDPEVARQTFVRSAREVAGLP